MPWSCSHNASRRVKASTPWNPGRSRTRLNSAGTRTDFEATRICLPAARCSRSVAFASKASRSTTITGVDGGASRAATAAVNRVASWSRSRVGGAIR